MKTTTEAFTRIELLAVCAAIALLALAVVPALAANKSDSERMVCFNHLRLVGRGVQVWAGDHNQQFSWRTLNSDGGTMPDTGTKSGNAWFEYVYLSNELVSPKILACPSDIGVMRAKSWPDFISPPFRNNAVSYPLHIDGSIDVPGTWLSADRNFAGNPIGGGCSARTTGSFAITTGILPSQSSVAWTNAVHGNYGHVLTTDGTVEFTSTSRLKELLVRRDIDDNGQTHFLKGR